MCSSCYELLSLLYKIKDDRCSIKQAAEAEAPQDEPAPEPEASDKRLELQELGRQLSTESTNCRWENVVDGKISPRTNLSPPPVQVNEDACRQTSERLSPRSTIEEEYDALDHVGIEATWPRTVSISGATGAKEVINGIYDLTGPGTYNGGPCWQKRDEEYWLLGRYGRWFVTDCEDKSGPTGSAGPRGFAKSSEAPVPTLADSWKIWNAGNWELQSISVKEAVEALRGAEILKAVNEISSALKTDPTEDGLREMIDRLKGLDESNPIISIADDRIIELQKNQVPEDAPAQNRKQLLEVARSLAARMENVERAGSPPEEGQIVGSSYDGPSMQLKSLERSSRKRELEPFNSLATYNSQHCLQVEESVAWRQIVSDEYDETSMQLKFLERSARKEQFECT